MTVKGIADHAEALAVAAALADEFRAGASARDAERRLPREELERPSAFGRLAVTVPAEHGTLPPRHGLLSPPSDGRVPVGSP